MGTPPLQILHRTRHRQTRRNRQKHMHVVSIYRSGVNDHLVSTRRLTKQFPTSIPDVTAENRKTIFRRPDHVILAVPDRVATALVPFHPPSLRCKMPPSQAA